MAKKDYSDIGKRIGEIVNEKQEAYGDSFNKACEVIEILYPDGIQPEQYKDFLAIIRVVDKLFRIATDKDAFGESPWKDIAGYALLSVVEDNLQKEQEEKVVRKQISETLKKIAEDNGDSLASNFGDDKHINMY